MKRDDDPELDLVDAVELAIEDLVEIPSEEMEPVRRRRRWTPHQGVTTQPEIRVGVMLGKWGQS